MHLKYTSLNSGLNSNIIWEKENEYQHKPDISNHCQIGQGELCHIMVTMVPTCFYLHLNLKWLSIQGFAVSCMQKQVSSITSDDTNLCDRLLNGNYFLNCNVYVITGAFSCHNKCTWMSVHVHHTVLQPEKKHIKTLGMDYCVSLAFCTKSMYATDKTVSNFMAIWVEDMG